VGRGQSRKGFGQFYCEVCRRCGSKVGLPMHPCRLALGGGEPARETGLTRSIGAIGSRTGSFSRTVSSVFIETMLLRSSVSHPQPNISKNGTWCTCSGRSGDSSRSTASGLYCDWMPPDIRLGRIRPCKGRTRPTLARPAGTLDVRGCMMFVEITLWKRRRG